MPIATCPISAPAAQAASACCQCQQKAFFHASSVSAQGVVIKKSFCLTHAHQAGLLHPKSWDILSLSSPARPSVVEKTCRCGMVEGILRHKGRAGCPRCYATFAHLFSPVVARVQHAPFHAGKTPHCVPLPNVRRRVAALKMALERAIRAQSHEQAAQVRQELAMLVEKTTR